MATITNKKQYPSEQYLNELITNMEFAARAPVEVVRAMAAELQKRRKADSAEPVAWRYRTTDINGNPNPRWSFSEEPSLLGLYQPLYADPQQPLSFPDAMEPTVEAIKRVLPTSNPDEYAVCIGADMWNACRTAMLQGVEPVSNHDELALYYLQGQKDGLEWAAQLAEANHPLTGDWLYDDPLELAKAIRKGPDMPGFAGSSPVTPDGWISCSERMPDNDESKPIAIFTGKCLGQGMFVATYDDDGFFDYWEGMEIIGVTHWMPLPEPPQEEK
ncbi:Eaa protein [Salmonella enterica subsp. enterica]|nr:Eaa protein [Salmonella enterica subsp. enterica]